MKNCFAPDQLLATIDMCASSYPDLQPWQVRRVCMSRNDEELVANGSHHSEDHKNDLEDLYYIYLTQLLHPMDGHDLARKDNVLVRVSAMGKGDLCLS